MDREELSNISDQFYDLAQELYSVGLSLDYVFILYDALGLTTAYGLSYRNYHNIDNKNLQLKQWLNVLAKKELITLNMTYNKYSMLWYNSFSVTPSLVKYLKLLESKMFFKIGDSMKFNPDYDLKWLEETSIMPMECEP